MKERNNRPTGWTTFTRRTDDPKLFWLERELELRFIPCRREGESFHAPILYVKECHLEAAWAVLTPEIDEMADDHPMFVEAKADWDACCDAVERLVGDTE